MCQRRITFNRTSLELKHFSIEYGCAYGGTFNRTSLELKLGRLFAACRRRLLLIAPVWN